MPRSRALLLCIVASASAIASCMSSDDAPAPPLLFSLERRVQPDGLLYVYLDNQWSFFSWQTCSQLSGTLDQSTKLALRDDINDPRLLSVVTPADRCPEGSFELRLPGAGDANCWSDDGVRSNPVAANLAAFYAGRVAELHWDGVVRDCTVHPR
jgi:hypothetical protein